MPRKTKQDQADTVIVYEASPGRAPASAHDAADELLPPEHRLSDEERAQPALTWLHQDASHGGESEPNGAGSATRERRQHPLPVR